MPDFTQKTYWCCETAFNWSLEIKDRDGKTYIVRWDNINHKNRDCVTYDYSCSCPAYKFGDGRACKHIINVGKNHCNWYQFTDGDEPIIKDGEYYCPKCGKRALPQVFVE
jgi:hypothetical protein